MKKNGELCIKDKYMSYIIPSEGLLWSVCAYFDCLFAFAMLELKLIK